MKFKTWLTAFSLLALIFSCSKSERVVDDPQQGTISVSTDGSFEGVTDALTERYMALNPKTKINVVVQKEDLGFLDLLENKVRVIVMSRELSKDEMSAYNSKIDMKMEPAKFAADAVVFIVPLNSPRNSISVKEIEDELKSENKNIIFDGTNSSNLNFVAQKYNMKPAELKFSIIKGNANIISEISKYSGKIGAISLNTLSRPYDKDAEELRKSVKILPVVENNKSFDPTINNVREMTYPFTRVLYFITNEGYYGLGNGFIRFSCQQLGQIVVEKEGLQPYNIFKREVQMR